MKKFIYFLLFTIILCSSLLLIASASEWEESNVDPNMILQEPYGSFGITWEVPGNDYVPDINEYYVGTTSAKQNYAWFNRAAFMEDKNPMRLAVYRGEDEGADLYYYNESYRYDFYWYVTDQGLPCFAIQDAIAGETVLFFSSGNGLYLNDLDGITYIHSDDDFKVYFFFDWEDLFDMNIQSYIPSGQGRINAFFNSLSSNYTISTKQDQINYQNGYADGSSYGLTRGYNEGFRIGREMGQNDILKTNDGVSTMIGAIFEAPYRFLSSFLDVEIFGIDIFSIITSVISICLIAFCLSFVIKFIGHFRS